MTTDRIECDAAQLQIDRAFASELTDAERATLMRHLDGCEECRGYYDVVEDLAAAKVGEPDEAEFLAMRREVIRGIRREAAADAAPSWGALPWFFRFTTVVAAITAAGVLFALGLFAGKAGRPRPAAAEPVVAQASNPDVVLARQIGAVARNNRALADVENSPFRYSNVEVEEQDPDHVRLSFDVSRHLRLTLRRDDPLVTEVLVQSVLDPSSVGSQLDAIAQAPDVLDPRIRGALVKAMLHDTNLGVRLQAQSRLAESESHGETGDAMLTVLEREPSVQMRLVAIDYLTRSRVDPKRLQQAVAAGEPEGRAAVDVKALNYIQSF